MDIKEKSEIKLKQNLKYLEIISENDYNDIDEDK